MDLPAYLRIQAHANALSNQRLGLALQALDAAAWQAPRTSFFPSLARTLNHILAVDHYYVGALHGDAGLREAYAAFQPCASADEWLRRQRASDLRLVAFCEQLDAAGRPGSRCRAPTTCSATVPAMCWRTCSTTRRTIAARCMPCWPAPRWRRRSWMNS